MNIYSETAEKLDKLRRNETRMSQEQFVRYTSALKKYRREIIAGANEILRYFWLNGIIAKNEGERNILCKEIQKIIDDEIAKGEMKRLKDILFQNYSLDEFLNAAYRVHCRIRYEAYAPYWTGTCEKNPLSDGMLWAGLK